MRAFFYALLILTAASELSVHGDINKPPRREVTLSLTSVFIPPNLTSTEDAIIYVGGILPDSCYEWSRAEVLSVTPFEHDLRAVGTHAQTMCLMVVKEFNEEVHLGILQSGNHLLRVYSKEGEITQHQFHVN